MSLQTVLIADDEEHIRNLLGMYFQNEGFDVKFARDGKEALELCSGLDLHMLLLDIMMPEIDGLEVCRRLRRDSQVPIIMLTAKNDGIDKVLALEMGADDYITKPFNPREVLARVKTVLRRTGDIPSASAVSSVESVAHFPQLEVYKDSYKVVVNHETVFLTSKEMEILWLLTRNLGRVFTREQLLDQVWGYDYYGDSRTVDTHIKRLRQKIGNGSVPAWDISTVWGVGYKFEVKS